MNIKETKQEIINTVKAYLCKNAEGEYRIPAIRQRPVLLMGPPGIGKTQIMEQIASECGIGLVSYTITHHTRQSAVGLPMIKTEEFDGKEYSVTEYTMSEIISGVYKAVKEQGHREGILFIDEINCVSETLIPTMLQFLQCKTFGNQKVPEGWIIVAAGNPPEFNRSVREFDMVTYDRLRVINIDADLEVWREYAREREIHNAILSYLDIRPQNFYRVEADVDGLKFVTARGWEDMSSLMYVYEELGVAMRQMHDGVSETKAVECFGRRCLLQQYLRFCSLITQNMKKGAEGMLAILETEAMDSLERRKEHALQLGEKAGTRLLFPMMLMLLIVMGIIMVPAFMTM